MEILGERIPKATWKHVVFGMGLSIETWKSSIPELLGEMLCVTCSTLSEFLENLSKVHSNIAGAMQKHKLWVS